MRCVSFDQLLRSAERAAYVASDVLHCEIAVYPWVACHLKSCRLDTPQKPESIRCEIRRGLHRRRFASPRALFSMPARRECTNLLCERTVTPPGVLGASCGEYAETGVHPSASGDLGSRVHSTREDVRKNNRSYITRRLMAPETPRNRYIRDIWSFKVPQNAYLAL